MKRKEPEQVFIYWDNSNIFISSKQVAEQREHFNVRSRVRIHFENLYKLAARGRQVVSAVAVGSVPREMRQVWTRLEDVGIKVQLQERGELTGTEQGVDQMLQTCMLRDALDYAPGVACLMTGDGRGIHDGVGFHADLERLHKKGWRIEVLAWESSCSTLMREWVKNVGVFLPLERFYEEITFVKPASMEDSKGVFEIPGREARPITPTVWEQRQSA